MAAAASAGGYSYLAITDHSRSLGVANGLDPDRLRAQRQEIDACAAGIALLSGLRQDKATLTARLLLVLANPHVDIIAHPSGRLLERRPGGDFDWPRVFASAAERGVALEINANPSRLDLNAELARQVLAAGCLLSINCDAHDLDAFALIEYGIAVARQAGATPDRVINTWSLDRLNQWLTSRGQ